MNLRDRSVYIFDCDGVILQSNRLKSDAFAAAIEGESPERIDQFIAYHKANGGISRYEKFRHFYEVISPSYSVEASIQTATEAYAAIVKSKLLVCDFIPGFEDFIRSIRDVGARCFVNSGSDENELRFVFEVRGLNNYFDGIFGSPSTKYENMGRILTMVPDYGDALYFGDARLDREVALSFGLDFCFVSYETEWLEGRKVCQSLGSQMVEDFLVPSLTM